MAFVLRLCHTLCCLEKLPNSQSKPYSMCSHHAHRLSNSLAPIIYAAWKQVCCWENCRTRRNLVMDPRLVPFVATWRVLTGFLLFIFSFSRLKSTFGGPKIGSEKKSLKLATSHNIIAQIWARSGGSPDPLSALENAATLGKRAKTGSLIGPSNSPKDLFNWAPPALLLGFAISKQRLRRNYQFYCQVSF